MNTSTEKEISIDTRDLLENAIKVIYDYLIAPGKNEAKKRFRSLLNADPQIVAEMPAKDGSKVKLMLQLDHSEFRGRLIYRNFKKYLAQLVGIIKQALASNDTIPTRKEKQGQRFIVNIPAVLQFDSQMNVLILGINLQNPDGIIIELLFFEPTQFKDVDKIVKR